MLRSGFPLSAPCGCREGGPFDFFMLQFGGAGREQNYVERFFY